MKLKIYTITAAFALMATALSWQGCGKDDKTIPCNIPNADLSYTKNIKRIVDQQCISCHSGSGPGPDSYTTYEGIKPLLDNKKVYDRVVIKKDMPQNGGMSQAQRDSINCWIAAGYPK